MFWTFFPTLSFSISAIKFPCTLIYYTGILVIDNYNRIGLFIWISRVEFKCDFIRVLTPLCTLKGKSVVFPQMAFKDYHFVLLVFEQGEKIYCQKDTKCVSRKFRQIGRILFSKWAYYVFCVKFWSFKQVCCHISDDLRLRNLVRTDMNREMSWHR